MTLKLENGQSFAQGSSPFRCAPATEKERSLRIFVPIQIDNLPTEAMIDTGGIYLICNPEIARRLELDPKDRLENEEVWIRGERVRGTLHRCFLTLLAEKGCNVQLEATVFAPQSESQMLWDLPPIMGFQGCLERMRFAVDPTPGRETFYFGVCDEEA